MNRIIKALIFLNIIFLSSCASWYDSSANTMVKYSKIHKLKSSFNLDGRFVIKNGKNNSYGNFNWYKDKSLEVLSFNTPIGQTVAKIEMRKNQLAKLYANNQVYSGNNLNDLMLNNLGYVLPLSNMNSWVQGVPLPNVKVVYNEYGFNQLGWFIDYLDYLNDGSPKVIKISNSTLSIKLLITSN